MQAVNSNNLFKYTKEEDRLNYISHFIGAILSIIGLFYLLLVNRDLSLSITISVIIYSLGMFSLFTASALYHKEQDPNKRSTLKRLDHAMILVMIAGTYTPFCFVINTTSSYIILLLVYILSIIGIVIKVKYINVHKLISISIYLIVGWLALFMLKDMLSILDDTTLFYMVLGGITYTIGALVYALSKFKYHHALWHIIVLLAASFFFISVTTLL